jgi:hypothetical protein
MKTDFEKKLKEHSYSYQCNADGLYNLCLNNDTNGIINGRLICAEPNEEVIQVSNNGNEIEAIGSFKIKLLNEVKEPYFFIFAFQNTNNHCVEFIIIPKIELMRRLNKENRISKASRKISIVFWLMPDRFLYDCTGVGVEWEWYYLSLGVNGRMADGSVWDYTEYLNDWDRLKLV